MYMLLQLYILVLHRYMFFLSQLRLCKGISYAAVAAHADNSGRRRLAAMLVDHESQSSKQASLLQLVTWANMMQFLDLVLLHGHGILL